MTNLKDKLGKVLEKYYPLSLLSSEDELLKYFILDIHGFRQNKYKKIEVEFLEKFKGDFPKRDFFIENRINISDSEYGFGLVSSLLKNYCNALEEELKIVELKN